MATRVSTGVEVRELPGPERSLRVMAKGGGDPHRIVATLSFGFWAREAALVTAVRRTAG